jgi:AcrR family transcriptional regulator
LVDQLPVSDSPAAPSERSDARANRRRLIEAAHQVFRERGLDAEMKEIAERAGVGIGTIYRNFPGKDDLLAAIIAELITGLRATIQAAHDMDDPVESMRAYLRGGLALVDRYGDLMMVLKHGNLPPACREQFEHAGHTELLHSLVQRGIDRGAFRPDLNVEATAALLHAAMMPPILHELRRSHSLDEIAAAYLDLLVRGVLHHS